MAGAAAAACRKLAQAHQAAAQPACRVGVPRRLWQRLFGQPPAGINSINSSNSTYNQYSHMMWLTH
jgi:hypothetical protein